MATTPAADECGQPWKRERRERGERRRNAGGLLEMRARRAGLDGERRQRQSIGDTASRRLLAMFRRVTS